MRHQKKTSPLCWFCATCILTPSMIKRIRIPRNKSSITVIKVSIIGFKNRIINFLVHCFYRGQAERIKSPLAWINSNVKIPDMVHCQMRESLIQDKAVVGQAYKVLHEERFHLALLADKLKHHLHTYPSISVRWNASESSKAICTTSGYDSSWSHTIEIKSSCHASDVECCLNIYPHSRTLGWECYTCCDVFSLWVPL